jgi:hypothetical protein
MGDAARRGVRCPAGVHDVVDCQVPLPGVPEQVGGASLSRASTSWDPYAIIAPVRDRSTRAVPGRSRLVGAP